MKIKFDNTLIDNDYVKALSQSSKLYNDEFRAGATLCIQVYLEVDKRGVSSQPSEVILLDDNDNKVLSLQVDNIDYSEDTYYAYDLTDKMVNFNVVYDWSGLADPTVQNIVNAMCSSILGTTAPNVAYMSDLIVTWDQDVQARDFISYVAEVNGCYARINENDELEFIGINREATDTIDVETCADFKLGEHHVIDRIVYNYGVASYKYPLDEDYTGTGETYYVNPDNILITDSQSYSIEMIIQSMYGALNGFEYYDVKTTKCQFDVSIQAGDIINFLYDGVNYPTIAQFEWKYNNGWYGGFELKLENKVQIETQIVSAREKLYNDVKILVDRETGSIQQQITGIEGDISNLQQTADEFQTTFVRRNDQDYQDLVTNIVFDADGVNISSSNIDTSLQLAASSVSFKDVNDNNIASFSPKRTTMGDWVLQQTGDVLIFFKEN